MARRVIVGLLDRIIHIDYCQFYYPVFFFLLK